MLCGWCATRRRHCCVRMMSSLRHHLPFSTSLTFLSFPPQTRFRLFPLPFLPLPHRLTQTSLMRHTLNTRLRLTRLRHDLDSTHFKSLHTTHSYSPVSTSVPPAFFSFIMGLSFTRSSSHSRSILSHVSDRSPRPHLFVRCKRPHLERGCSTRPTRVE